MNRKYLWTLLIVITAAVFMNMAVYAGNEVFQKDDGNDTAVRELLKKTFPQLTVDELRKAPIAGLYEIQGGGNIIYFDPKTSLIVFGDILNKGGKNLTAEKRNEVAAKMLSKIPLDKAIKIGNGPNRVVLFTDPDCPYCRNLANYFKTKSADITEYVFFSPLKQIHPNAEAKAKYILSQKDPGKAYDKVMAGALDKEDAKNIKFDDGSAVKLAENIALASSVGIKGVPAMWIGDTYVAGANIPMIEKLLKSK